MAILPAPANAGANDLASEKFQEPDPQAVINRLITTATNQGALIAEQRQLLSDTLTYVPAGLAAEIRECLADSMLKREMNNDDLIVIEDVAEGGTTC